MELTLKPTPKGEYQVSHPIFFNDEVIGVLEGKRILGRLARSSVAAFRTETRSSFKHPIAGLLMGMVMTGVPLQAMAGDPLGLWWLTLASPMRVVGSFFMFCFGLYLLFSVMSRHDETWIVFVTASGEAAYCVVDELSEETTQVLQALMNNDKERG